MTTAAKILTPFLVALALSLQGCFMFDYPWAVKISIAEHCAEKIKELEKSADTEKDLHLEECDEMDEDKMDEFGITADNCKEAVKDQLKFFLGVGCKAKVGAEVFEKCGGQSDLMSGLEMSPSPSPDTEPPTPAPPEEEKDRRLDSDKDDKDGEDDEDDDDAPGFDTDKCKEAIQTAVKGFEPEPVSEEMEEIDGGQEDMLEDEEEELEEDGTEAYVALVMQCHDAIEKAVKNNNGKEFYKGVCANVTEEKNMKALDVDDKDCSKYMDNLYKDVGVFACVVETMFSPDTPEVKDITSDDIKEGVDEFMGHLKEFPTVEELQMYVLSSVFPMAMMASGTMGGMMGEEEARLRLYQNMRKGRLFGRNRRRGLSTTAIAASSALALAALAAVAWRARAGRKGAVEKEQEPMMAEEPVA